LIETHNIVLDVRDQRVLNTDIVMVQNDSKSNVLHITMQGVLDWTGVTGQAKYRRSDGLAVVDGIVFINGVADHVVPLAALNIAGAVQCEVSLIMGDIRATTNQIIFLVREEIDADSAVSNDDRVPILEKLIEDTKTINGVAKTEADRAKSEADRAILVWKGAYSPTTTYLISNAVAYNGSSYVALKTVIGVTPTNDGVNWLLVAQKGDTGGGSAGVGSFNGRSGEVAPQAGDYTAEMVGAAQASHTHDAADIAQDASHRFVSDTEKITWGSKATKANYTATLTAASWAGTVAPYIYTLSLTGILATDIPHISPNYSATLATAKLEKAAWVCIDDADATATNTIVFRCLETKPTQNLDIIVEVMR
jgi:hypothetical protein